MMPRDARMLCALTEPDDAADKLRHAGIGPAELAGLLAESDSFVPEPGVISVQLNDHGRHSQMRVLVPESVGSRPGVLIVLHGAGGTGAGMLPYFASLGERLSMVVVCPDAQVLDEPSANLDVSGIFGKRFRLPRWNLRRDDFPMAALRWALTYLDVDPDRCVLAGLSMGGLATWNLGMRLWQHFSSAVPINGALSIWELFGADRESHFLLPNAIALPLFVLHGALDARIPPELDRTSVSELRALGHSALDYLEVADGTHAIGSLHLDEGNDVLARLEHWLVDRRRHPDPSCIRHRALDDTHGRAHWLQAGGVAPRHGSVLHADRLAADMYRIEASGAARVLLYLTGNRLRPGQPVRVMINGITSTVLFKPDLRTLVDSYHRDADHALAAVQVAEFAVAGSGQEASCHMDWPDHAVTY